MSLDEATRGQIQTLVEGNPVVLFMKGNRQAPQCGFSATVVRILDTLLPAYQTFDVLSDPAVREGIKDFSSWPTIPQLYVRGEFLGGCDIIQEMFASGELLTALGIEVPKTPEPTLNITDPAADGLRRAAESAPEGHAIHLGIDARYQASLFLAPVADREIQVEASGVTLHMDALSAQRAEDVTIDMQETPQGAAFRVRIPNAPNAVGQMSVRDLEKRLAGGEKFELLDVRTPEERARASIPGSVLVTPEESTRLEQLPKDTMLVFHCHHGGRSQAAADHFAALGFTKVWNVVGGVDAWSQEVDPSVPRY